MKSQFTMRYGSDFQFEKSLEALLKEERQRTLKGAIEKLPEAESDYRLNLNNPVSLEEKSGWNKYRLVALSELEGEITSKEGEKEV